MDSGESRRKPRATLRLASRFFQREIVKKKRFLQKSAAAACTPRGLKISEASEDERKKFSFLTVFPPGKPEGLTGKTANRNGKAFPISRSCAAEGRTGTKYETSGAVRWGPPRKRHLLLTGLHRDQIIQQRKRRRKHPLLRWCRARSEPANPRSGSSACRTCCTPWCSC